MTGTDLCVNKCKKSQSYLNHLVYIYRIIATILSQLLVFLSYWYRNKRLLMHF